MQGHRKRRRSDQSDLDPGDLPDKIHKLDRKLEEANEQIFRCELRCQQLVADIEVNQREYQQQMVKKERQCKLSVETECAMMQRIVLLEQDLQRLSSGLALDYVSARQSSQFQSVSVDKVHSMYLTNPGVNVQSSVFSHGVDSQRNSVIESYSNDGYVPQSPRRRDIPLPRQVVFDGKSSWESFIIQFNMMCKSCDWDEAEKHFRLISSLCGGALDYVFCELRLDVTSSYDQLVKALEARYQDRKPASVYLSQLGVRKLQPNEDISQYVADLRSLVRKGYTKANEDIRESIVLHHFVSGLGEASVGVGMTSPTSVEEAQDALHRLYSLQQRTGSHTEVSNVSPKADDTPVTMSDLRDWSTAVTNEIKSLKHSVQYSGCDRNMPEGAQGDITSGVSNPGQGN